MPRFERHIFVCVNQRPPGHAKGCCADKGSAAIRDRFKEELHRRGLSRRVRANQAGCLDLCERGPTVVVYPEQVWYAGVKLDDVEEIIERHIIGGEPVERLRVPDSVFESAPVKPGFRPPSLPPDQAKGVSGVSSGEPRSDGG